ncbi:MAG: amidohydrolase [Bacteroidia bacterium]|nr:amidohydrolase [Bacteroidia bacterium]
MNSDITISIIQTSLYWEDIPKNLQHFSEKIHAITTPTDIIVLPEMFSTGFTMNPKKIAETNDGEALQWMLQMAKIKDCVMVGSVAVKEDEVFYNRLYWVFPHGEVLHYNKRHLFQMGKEHQHYTAGKNKLMITYKGWKICPLICYDLRFPVWSRNTTKDIYDVLIYVANWPEARHYHWKQLLIARAIENQSYVIGVNRIGLDAHNINHSGDSMVINPRGEIISSIEAHEDKTETLALSYQYLQEYRTAFPALSDADEFRIKE